MTSPTQGAGVTVTVRLMCGLGFDDYDVARHAEVHRVCMGRNMRTGDVFNLYCSGGVNRGAWWKGDLATSMRAAHQPCPPARESQPEGAGGGRRGTCHRRTCRRNPRQR
jgi:hypothetical protein